MDRVILYHVWQEISTGRFHAQVHSLSAGAFPRGTAIPKVTGALSRENAERQLKLAVKNLIGGRGTRVKFEDVSLKGGE